RSLVITSFGIHAAFKAAHPWFDDYRWGWDFDPDAESGPAYRIWPSPPGARGVIEVFMHGASHEQANAVRAWLIREFRPRYEVPATRLMMELGERSRMPGHWAHLNP